MTDPTEAIRADNSCDLCHGTGHYYLYGNEGPKPCPCKTKPEVKPDPLREALTKVRPFIAEQSDYESGLDHFSEDVCAANILAEIDSALAAPPPPAPITTGQHREAIARIIDPEVFEALDELKTETVNPATERWIRKFFDERRLTAFAKADAILALSPPVATQPIIDIEAGARAIAITRGHDPDDLAPRTEMCTHDTQQVPWWKVFEEEASACLRTISPACERQATKRKAAKRARRGTE